MPWMYMLRELIRLVANNPAPLRISKLLHSHTWHKQVAVEFYALDVHVARTHPILQHPQTEYPETTAGREGCGFEI